MMNAQINDPHQLITDISIMGEEKDEHGIPGPALIAIEWNRGGDEALYRVARTRSGARLWLKDEATGDEAVLTFAGLPFRRNELMSHVTLTAASEPSATATARKKAAPSANGRHS